jgi:hypothetical protein
VVETSLDSGGRDQTQINLAIGSCQYNGLDSGLGATPPTKH